MNFKWKRYGPNCCDPFLSMFLLFDYECFLLHSNTRAIPNPDNSVQGTYLHSEWLIVSWQIHFLSLYLIDNEFAGCYYRFCIIFVFLFTFFFLRLGIFDFNDKVTQFGTIFLVFWWMLNEKEWVWCEKNVEVWPRKAASIVNFGFWCFPTSKSSHFTLFWQTNRQPECIHAESHKCIYLERRNHCMSLTVIRDMIFPSCVSLNH